jgi:predicted RNase H-like HicB family nuclease
MATEVQVVDLKEILKRPYARILTPDPDGRFTAEIMEFAGCVAFGDDAPSALANLEEVASEWITAATEQGQNIPNPINSADFSGKLVLRMSRGLHKRAILCAEREGVSLNQFIVTCLAEAVGERARPSLVYASSVQVSANLNLNLVICGSGTTGERSIAVVGHDLSSQSVGSTTSQRPLVIPARCRERVHAGG